MEDHLQLRSKAENRERRGLPKNPPAGLLPAQCGYLPLLHQPLKAGGKAPSAAHRPGHAECREALWQHRDLLLRPRGQGQGPNLGLQRSPVGAGERTGQVLGISLQTVCVGKEVAEGNCAHLGKTQRRG